MPLESWHKSRQAKAKMAKCILHSYVVVSLSMAEVLVKVAWMSPNSQTVADDEIPASSSFQQLPALIFHILPSPEIAGAKDFQDDLDQIPGAVARFLRREAPPQSGGAALRVAGAFALKARLCRMSNVNNFIFFTNMTRYEARIAARIVKLSKEK